MACFDENQIQAFLSLPGGSTHREQFEVHIDGCERCRNLLAELARASTPDMPLGAVEEECLWKMGRYQVKRRLGSGSMGVVYEGYDEQLCRPVALKLLHYAHTHTDRASKHNEAMVSEGRALARVNHPGLVAVYDIAWEDDAPYLVMELVQGIPLRDWISNQKPDRIQILKTMHRVASALGALHRARLLHRDVKPDNIMVENDGSPRLIDLSLVQSLDQSSAEDVVQSSWSQGKLAGTPAYMAPEQMRGEPIDERADVFGLFVTLYEALSGRRPFGSFSASFDGWPMPEALHDSPPGLWKLISKGLSSLPSERFSSMEEVQRSLGLLLATRSPSERSLL